MLMPNFIFCVPTLNRYDTCNKLIESVWSNTHKPDKVIVLDNGGGFEPTELADREDLEIHTSEYNIGVAKSFNYFLDYVSNEYPNHYVIISNDDLVLYDDTLEMLSHGIAANPGKWIYCSDLHAANSFSFFAVHPQTIIDEIGYFETAYHSYAEDTDLMHRARMVGWELLPVNGCSIKDHIGSGTLKAFTEDEERLFHTRRAKGIQEYVKKWGAAPEQGEVYNTPYNSGIDSVQWHREKFSRVSPF